MDSLRVADDIVPVSEFKARASVWFNRVAESKGPVVITQNGRAAGVLLAPRVYDELIERTRFISAVEEGLADVEAGRTVDHATVVAGVRARFGEPRDQ